MTGSMGAIAIVSGQARTMVADARSAMMSQKTQVVSILTPQSSTPRLESAALLKIQRHHEMPAKASTPG
ncbi:hypothetical protein [Acrocarpospora macrocephala]|uniref:hypothetical protein n=1 Tax=Acrocarpospora macrocephala TaxID=150177 RepID=UPI001FE684C7|nr:hypothetical protein [Acrocarpospora macrocephala]